MLYNVSTISISIQYILHAFSIQHMLYVLYLNIYYIQCIPACTIRYTDSLEIGCVDYPVKPSSFQHVNNITLFFSDNFGGDHTSLSYLGFSGEDLKVKKGVVECVYESQANHADHPKAKDEDLKGGFSTGI